jgi:hypothetical protein
MKSRVRTPEPKPSRAAIALLTFALLLLPSEAHAFCIATTCDSKKEVCPTEKGCVVGGAQVHWDSRCLSFGTQRDGSPKRHITYTVADHIIQGAFEQWMHADCGGGQTPSFRVWDLGEPYGGIICDVPQFNDSGPNANVWMFRDDDWPYKDEASTLALTSTLFDQTTGALLDADVEINSFAINLTTTDVAGNVVRDLASIVTHEAGHFLGMAHSQVETATMYREYKSGDLNYRSLHADDVAGICALYPPDRDVPACNGPSPPHGFTLYCGSGSDPPQNGCQCRLERGVWNGRAAGGAAFVSFACVLSAFVRRRGQNRGAPGRRR